MQLYHYYLFIFFKLYLFNNWSINNIDKNIKQDIKKLPLDRILINNGYYYDKEKTSQNYKVVKNDNEDKIIISQTKSGNYLYFNKTANNS